MTADALLARVRHDIERISDEQHRLARRRVVLEQCATELRMGANPNVIRERLRAFEETEATTR